MLDASFSRRFAWARGARPLALSACVLAVAACKRDGKAKGPPPPSPVVVAFYSVRIASRSTGAPTAAELRQFAPFLSDTLTALLKAAAALRDREARRAPSEKPPFVEGDLFSSMFEGPTSFAIVRDSLAGMQNKSVVRFTYVSNGDSYTWTDTVTLGKKGRTEVIEDIAYGGAGAFGNHGTLRTTLEAALADVVPPKP